MKVRKIAALGIGAAMVGATLGIANAQASLPPKEFFVKDGAPNVKIVVGANAPSTMDVASASDVAVALGSLLYTAEEVEASGVSVVVKKDATYYPGDIPVYSNFYEDTGVDPNATNEALDDLADDAFWWNGSAYNGSYDTWVAVTPKFVEEVDNMDEIKGDKQIDWDLQIENLELIDAEQDVIEYPPKTADLKIPAGNFTILLNYVITKWEKTTTENDSVWGSLKQTETTDTVIDDDNPGGYTAVETVYDGISAEDTFTVLGTSYYVLEVLDDGLKYGTDHGVQWFHVGDVKEFDGYKIKTVDISISPANKVLLEITAPDGRSDLVIIEKTDPPSAIDVSTKSDKFEEGELIIQLDDTFVGIDGNLIAQLEVKTNVVEVHSGDELLSGWLVNFGIENGVIKWITLSNKDDLEGSTLDILGKYKMYYKSEIVAEDVDDDDVKEYAVKSYIVVEPTEKVYDTKELKVGDELEGWTIDKITAGTYTEITVMPPTEPITYLDTEIDVNAVDSNLILIGGPVANAITKYLVDQGLSTVDWEASEGDLEYIEGAFGEYGALIVAGKDRYATREAAKELMAYLKDLA